jgi:hypothetical protein
MTKPTGGGRSSLPLPLRTSGIAACILAMATTVAGFEGDDLGAYLTEANGQHMLKEKLVLREEQGGFAGLTGTIWTIEPSGHWRVESFRPDKAGNEELTTRREGRMTAEQLATLAKGLAAQDLASLPAKLGRDAKVNPHRYSLKFGKKHSTLAGVGPRRDQSIRENILKAATSKEAPEDEPLVRFAHIAHIVEGSCTAPESK